jgi:hypothetical protein
MHRFPHAWSLLVAASVAAAMLADCGGLGSATASGGNVPNPTPTPTSSPTSSPGPCATMDANNANLVVVAMSGGISPITVPSYPPVFGYGVSDVDLDVPSQSQLINITAFGGTVPITTQNTVQFFNAEAIGSTTLHSAYGFKGNGFPTQFTFPSPAPSPTATTIANNVTWFTGLLATEDNVGDTCFSPEFTLTKGTYYFGDYNAYDSTNFRGVLIVSTPGPASMRHRFHFTRVRPSRRR